MVVQAWPAVYLVLFIWHYSGYDPGGLQNCPHDCDSLCHHKSCTELQPVALILNLSPVCQGSMGESSRTPAWKTIFFLKKKRNFCLQRTVFLFSIRSCLCQFFPFNFWFCQGFSVYVSLSLFVSFSLFLIIDFKSGFLKFLEETLILYIVFMIDIYCTYIHHIF